ncbi:MAG: PadR family transcriptional regulator [Oscillospiraceae bacterium]|nr:PadR family transcriptional regulator [Oscillospiraceae bacterium]
MAIASDLIRGHTDTIILAHLYGSESYGYEVNKSIYDKSNGVFELKEATLYGAFRRLEETGCITSFWGDEATGARRRYYRITEKGRKQLNDSSAEWQDAKKLIDILIKYEEGEGQ